MKFFHFVRFGNLYEYRSAFFSDVMYSNNVPGREGTVRFVMLLCTYSEQINTNQ